MTVFLAIASMIICMMLIIALGPPRSNLGYRFVVVAGYGLSMAGVVWRRERNKLIH
jgi:hypothetical protein